jgi:2-dehydro-3-deoxyphosphogluconate aldolase/(4S)-4-hydroxy-2-oxoglutarate aldolase
VGNSSIFAGTAIEAMKTPYLGAKGHIAIGTTDMEAAVEYLTTKGVKFNQDSAKYKDDKLTAIYLEQEIGGFAVHLVKK